MVANSPVDHTSLLPLRMEKKGKGKCEVKEPRSKEHVGGEVVGKIQKKRKKAKKAMVGVNQRIERDVPVRR